MAIGNWGSDVIFTTSDLKILTFNDFSQTVGSDWATHSRIGQKDRVEYLRPKLRKVTFGIVLDAMLGVRPRTVLEMMEDHAEKGHVFPLVIGCKRVGRYQWRMTEVGETWEEILNRGELVKAKLNISMEEYL